MSGEIKKRVKEKTRRAFAIGHTVVTLRTSKYYHVMTCDCSAAIAGQNRSSALNTATGTHAATQPDGRRSHVSENLPRPSENRT